MALGASPLENEAGRRAGYLLIGALIIVGEPHDIVFSKIIAVLHFDHDELSVSGIFQTMQRARGNKDRFVDVRFSHLIANRDHCRARNNHPVLAAVIMVLQA